MANNLMMPFQADPNRRKTRTPSFPCAGTMKPYGLYPLMIHPVLPGETLQSATIKLRHISMPIKYPLGGAWLETWLVYVKLTDLDKDLGQMFVEDGYSTTGWVQGSDVEQYFVKSGQHNWVYKCLTKFYESYFIDETVSATNSIDSNTALQVKLNNRSWYENMAFQDADVAVPTTDASDLYKHLQDYTVLQQMGMIEMTYEKYLAQYGSQMPRETEGDPEILRFARSWTLPKNHVEATTGAPSSAWVWSDEIKADKPKKFNEPGFLVAFQTVRPKMYQNHLRASMVGNMFGYSDWFPIYTLNDPTAGIKEIDTDDLVFETASRVDVGEKTMIYDHRDLLMQGETFINDWTNNPYDYPVSSGLTMEDAATNSDLRGEYATETDIDNLFVGATESDKRCYYDGIVNLTISGHVQQSTPR